MTTQPDIEGIRRRIAATIHAHWKLVLAQGILLMVFGLLAVAMPNIATLAVEIFVGWLFFIAGIFRAVSVWQARRMPGYAWSMLSALLAVLLGLILILRPLAGVLTLTMVLIAFFILEGITAIVVAVQHREHLNAVQRHHRPLARLPDLAGLAELGELGDRPPRRHQYDFLRPLSGDDGTRGAVDGPTMRADGALRL